MITTITAPSTVAPATDKAVSTANDLINLAVKAEQVPEVKADLQAQFDTYSHNPIIMGVVTIIGVILTRQNITVDNTLLTVAVGLVATGVGYAWQWISMKIRKPVPAAVVNVVATKATP